MYNMFVALSNGSNSEALNPYVQSENLLMRYLGEAAFMISSGFNYRQDRLSCLKVPCIARVGFQQRNTNMILRIIGGFRV